MIYKTEFNPKTKQCTSGSTPTVFNNLDEVVVVHGEPKARTRAWIVYDDVIFSHLLWHVEDTVSFL